ncbi:MAG: preprotein translocase subunit SecE [Actinomycetota bacterium]|jgi:preprotein translocase subunit SecE|nr:preprotein translocase subunit SecE [Actinomycetota bacterium]
MQKEEEKKKGGTPRSPKPPGSPTKKQRTKPRQFFREVMAEMRKVAWPTRQEVVAYSIVVLVSTIVIGALVYGMDYVFSRGVLKLFGINS